MSHQTPSLTAVVHAVVKRAPSGLTAETIAALMGKDYQTLMSELSSQPRHKFDADLVLEAMNLAESDEPLHFLAKQRGGVFIKLPQVEGDGPIHGAVMASIKETGEFLSEVGKDLADGKLTIDECDGLEREAHEAATAIMGLIRLVADYRRGGAK